MGLRSVVLGAVITAVRLHACTGPGPRGRTGLRATIVGLNDVPATADTVRFDGPSVFRTGRADYLGVRGPFDVASEGEGPSTHQRVSLVRSGGGRPRVGRYGLAPLDRADPGGRFYAVYARDPVTPGDTTTGYVSTAGELVITYSSPSRVEGTFQFTGAEYAARWPTGGRGSMRVDVVPPGAATITVQGAFAADLDTRPAFEQRSGGQPEPRESPGASWPRSPGLPRALGARALCAVCRVRSRVGGVRPPSDGRETWARPWVARVVSDCGPPGAPAAS